jgi:hypothetical protein
VIVNMLLREQFPVINVQNCDRQNLNEHECVNDAASHLSPTLNIESFRHVLNPRDQE